MFVHNKKLQYTVHVDAPNAAFAKLCLEQFGGPNGELAAAMRYFTQGWAESDPGGGDALTFLMTREVAHQKMFESALASITNNFPSSNVPPDERFTHTYFDESTGT